MFFPSFDRYNMSGLGLSLPSFDAALQVGVSSQNVQTVIDSVKNLYDIREELNSYPSAPYDNIWQIDPVHPFSGKAYSKANEYYRNAVSVSWDQFTLNYQPDTLSGELAGAIGATSVIPGLAKKFYEKKYYPIIAEVNKYTLALDHINDVLLNPNKYTKEKIQLILDPLVKTATRIQSWWSGSQSEIKTKESTAQNLIDGYYKLLSDEKTRLDAIADDDERQQLEQERISAEEELKRIGLEQKAIQDASKEASDKKFQYLLIGGGALLLIGAYFLFFKKR